MVQNGVEGGGFSILHFSFCHFLGPITKKIRMVEDFILFFLGGELLEKPLTLAFESHFSVFKCFSNKIGFSCPLSPLRF